MNMTKEDEEFLTRVAKEKPELLEVEGDEGHFHAVVDRLIKTPPQSKQKPKRKRHRRSEAK
jgi:hypothetical protein